jgi:DNA-binding Lrp family transcriptional regulator
MGLDSTDLRILSQFDSDAGISFAKFAKKLRMSRQALDYRVKKLIEAGVIKKFYSVVNFSALGYWQYKVYCKLQNLDVDSEDSITGFLKRTEGVTWVGKCRGRFDLTYSMVVKDPAEFATIQNRVYERFGTNIQEKDIFITENSVVFPKPFSPETSSHEEFLYGGAATRKELDEKDSRIVSFVAENGLASVPEIAKCTGLGPDSVFYRLKKLRKERILLETKADINLRKAGFSLYKIQIRLNSYQTELFSKIEGYARVRENCVQYLKLLGRWDIELEYLVKNTDELQEELAGLRKLFADSIRDHEVLEVYEESELNFYPFKKPMP